MCDAFHPTATPTEIVELAPRAELVLKWREPEEVHEAVAHVCAVLKSHTPVMPGEG
jgi:hypothetical protein